MKNVFIIVFASILSASCKDPYNIQLKDTDKSMLVVGLYNGILVNPNGPEDFIGSGNVKEADSVIMWFGPDARCVGPNGSTTAYSPGGLKTYRLVDANA